MGNGSLGRDVENTYLAEVKERVEIYLFPRGAFIACSKVGFVL
jgi:hypothetical protein